MADADLTQIDGVDVMTAMTILSEVGWDMSKWKTEHHFVSWLRLCPDNKISGDKIIGKGRLPTTNRATSTLRMAASTLRVSNTYLGAQFRRLRTKLGASIAIKAMAAKLARLVYRRTRGVSADHSFCALGGGGKQNGKPAHKTWLPIGFSLLVLCRARTQTRAGIETELPSGGHWLQKQRNFGSPFAKYDLLLTIGLE
jgi:hypothetical protein